MSDERFTPGPWRIGTANGYNASNIYTDDGENGICQMYGIALHRTVNEVQSDPGMANARLIAAAPDLYRELAYLVSMIEPLEREGRIQIPGIATLNGARAALAKARGK